VGKKGESEAIDLTREKKEEIFSFFDTKRNKLLKKRSPHLESGEKKRKKKKHSGTSLGRGNGTRFLMLCQKKKKE